jgi:hypothetical protein
MKKCGTSRASRSRARLLRSGFEREHRRGDGPVVKGEGVVFEDDADIRRYLGETLDGLSAGRTNLRTST